MKLEYANLTEWEELSRLPNAQEGDLVALFSPETGALRFANEVDPGEQNFAFLDGGSFPVGLCWAEAVYRAVREGFPDPRRSKFTTQAGDMTIQTAKETL